MSKDKLGAVIIFIRIIFNGFPTIFKSIKIGLFFNQYFSTSRIMNWFDRTRYLSWERWWRLLLKAPLLNSLFVSSVTWSLQGHLEIPSEVHSSQLNVLASVIFIAHAGSFYPHPTIRDRIIRHMWNELELIAEMAFALRFNCISAPPITPLSLSSC